MKKHRCLLSLIIFIMFSFSLYSQSSALVLMNLDIEDEDLLNETKEQIVTQVKKELERKNLAYLDEVSIASIISDKKLSEDQLIEETVLYTLGKEAGVPVVITVEALEKESFLEFIVAAFDVEGEKALASNRKVSSSSVSRHIMINSSISSILDKLTGEYGIASIALEPKVRKITFISDQEGLEIYTDNGEYLGEIAQSILNVTDREFDIGTELLVVKKLFGYRDAYEVVTLDKERSTVTLEDLNKAQVLAFQMNWTYMQLLGLGTGIRYYPVPDWMFVSFDNYVYIQKDFSTDYGNESYHNDFRFLIGTYLFSGPESLFRFNVSIGGGVIFSYPYDRSETYYDYYLNLLNISLELNLADWSFYIRPELKIALNLDENSYLDGGLILSTESIPPITIGVLKKW